MSQPTGRQAAPSSIRRKLYLAAIAAGAVILLLVASAVMTLRSAWFAEQVRLRIIREAETATGGKVRLAKFAFDWRSLLVTLEGFELRGKEPAESPPLFAADRVELGLRIVSLLRRDIDLASLRVRRPRVLLLLDSEGKSNLPEPRVQRRRASTIETIVRLAIGHTEFQDGYFEFREHRIPLDFQGERLEAAFDYEFVGPRYRGRVDFAKVRFDSPFIEPLAADLHLALTVDRESLSIEPLTLSLNQSQVKANGYIRLGEVPTMRLRVDSKVLVAEIAPIFRLPVERHGEAVFHGEFRAAGGEGWRFQGGVEARGLGYRRAKIRIPTARFRTFIDAGPEGFSAPDLQAEALNGRFAGKLEMPGYRSLALSGSLAGFRLEELADFAGPQRLKLAGEVSGNANFRAELAQSGFRTAVLRAELNIRSQRTESHLHAAAGPLLPVDGLLRFEWRQSGNRLSVFPPSNLTLPRTGLHFSGAAGQKLEVGLLSRDLDELLTVLEVAGVAAPSPFPVSVRNGQARFDGFLEGPLDNPSIQGRVALRNAQVKEFAIESLSADVQINSGLFDIPGFLIQKENMRVSGDIRVELDAWRVKPSSQMMADINFREAPLGRLLAEGFGRSDADGVLSGAIQLRGPVAGPQVNADLSLAGARFGSQRFDLAALRLKLDSARPQRVAGTLNLDLTRFEFSGSYRHPEEDFRRGTLDFRVEGKGFPVRSLEFARQLDPDISGFLSLQVSGGLSVFPDAVLPERLDGSIVLERARIRGRALDRLEVQAATRDRSIQLSSRGLFQRTGVQAIATIQLAGDYPLAGRVELTGVDLGDAIALAGSGTSASGKGASQPELPLAGSFDAALIFDLTLRGNRPLRGRCEITDLVVRPRPAAWAMEDYSSELQFTNRGPLVLEITARTVRLLQARLSGPETDLVIGGTYALGGNAAWDLRFQGNANLAVLNSFRPDILAGGTSAVNAVLRGGPSGTQLSGLMDVKNASFYVADSPVGIEQVNGRIRFSQDRAVIERLTGKSGGGDVEINGYLGLTSDRAVYRLSVSGKNVRVRYPVGFSSTVEANLNLSGTRDRSLLLGSVTVVRTALSAENSGAGLLRQSSGAVIAPVTNNPFLQGLQFDVRINTRPETQFIMSMLRDVSLDADLRLRGTPSKPILLGRVTVGQGQIEFFGNRYSITRGEISFYNTATVEPVLDLDVETRVRGVTVSINVAGPPNKLNVSYRSDPPLQSQEIVALLTVGRTPDSTSLASYTLNATPSSGSPLQMGPAGLIGQALATPFSNRLERFFGVSRIKIDPTVTGVDNLPEAHLTIEQQISRDITLTYSTNLSRTQQQLIRLQWDLSRQLSLIIVRDEYGSFGLDFFVRKRF